MTKMVRIIFLATKRYAKTHNWVAYNNGNPVSEMRDFETADRNMREVCPGIFLSTAPSIDRGTRVTSYFDREGLAGLVVETELA